jgi:hypothetical protein
VSPQQFLKAGSRPLFITSGRIAKKTPPPKVVRVVFYAIRVVSKESRRVVLPGNSFTSYFTSMSVSKPVFPVNVGMNIPPPVVAVIGVFFARLSTSRNSVQYLHVRLHINTSYKNHLSSCYII